MPRRLKGSYPQFYNGFKRPSVIMTLLIIVALVIMFQYVVTSCSLLKTVQRGFYQ